MAPPGLDGLDRAILDLIQRDARMPQHEIGTRVNLSAAAVQRRVRRMEADGVVRGVAAILDPARVGRPLTIVAGVEVDSEHSALLDATREALAAAPEVQQCYYVTGDLDFILVLTAADMGEYEAISRRLFLANPNVRRFKTYVAMQTVKAGLAVPLRPGRGATP